MSSSVIGNIHIRATISGVWEEWGWLHLNPLNSDVMALNFLFLRKKNALRDFAAFHFMSTNKRTKKPFWREECVYVCICA